MAQALSRTLQAPNTAVALELDWLDWLSQLADQPTLEKQKNTIQIQSAPHLSPHVISPQKSSPRHPAPFSRHCYAATLHWPWNRLTLAPAQASQE